MSVGYYIFFGTNSDGVVNKINNQIRVFNKYGHCTKILIEKPKRLSLLEKIMRSWPTAALGYSFEPYLEMLDEPNYIYIRRTTVDSGLIDYLHAIKEKYPECTVIWELPVYPYFRDSYCNNTKHFLRMFPLYIKDVLYRRQLKKYVDYIATFSDYDTIFGIPSLHIRNGICVDDVKPIENRQFDDTIDLLSVAMMSPHHGFERIILGLAEYYKNGGIRNIKYHSVGYGEELEKYKQLVKQNGIESHVVFYGRKNGAELDAIYEKSDLAIASLGLYKKGIVVGSFIKTGEYLAKGLPMITGSKVDVLDKNEFDFFIEFPNDPSPIDMNKVVAFYDMICSKGKNMVIAQSRDYAYKKVDMVVAMKSVLDIISGNNK